MNWKAQPCSFQKPHCLQQMSLFFFFSKAITVLLSGSGAPVTSDTPVRSPGGWAKHWTLSTGAPWGCWLRGAGVSTLLWHWKINLSNENALSQIHSYEWQRKEGEDMEICFLMLLLRKDNQLENVYLGSFFTGSLSGKWPRRAALGIWQWGCQ